MEFRLVYLTPGGTLCLYTFEQLPCFSWKWNPTLVHSYFSERKTRLTTDLILTLCFCSQVLLPPACVVFVIGLLICSYLYIVIPMFLFEDSVCVDQLFKPVERWLCEPQCSYMQIQVISTTVFCMQWLCQPWIPKRNWSFSDLLIGGNLKERF